MKSSCWCGWWPVAVGAEKILLPPGVADPGEGPLVQCIATSTRDPEVHMYLVREKCGDGIHLLWPCPSFEGGTHPSLWASSILLGRRVTAGLIWRSISARPFFPPFLGAENGILGIPIAVPPPASTPFLPSGSGGWGIPQQVVRSRVDGHRWCFLLVRQQTSNSGTCAPWPPGQA